MENVVGAKVKFNKLSINGFDYRAENLEYFNVKESLTYPGITGTVSFRDWDDAKERNFIFPGQEVIIEAELKDWVLELPMNRYIVTGSYGDNPDPSMQYNTFNVTFESIFSVNAFTKKISKLWRNKRIDEIVSDLIIQCHPEKEKGIGVIIPTKGKLDRFYSPRWSVTDTFKYLTQFAVDDKDAGGYCIWMDITSGKVNFAPINYLYFNDQNGVYKSFYNGYNKDDKNLSNNPKITDTKTVLTRRTDSLYNNRRIENIQIEQTYDLMRYIDSGANHYSLVGFDHDYYKAVIVEQRANEFNMNTLSDNTIPLLPKYIGAKVTKEVSDENKPQNKADMNSKTFDVSDTSYRQTKFCTYYPNTDSLMTDSKATFSSDSQINGRLSTRMTNLLCDMIKLNLTTNGDPLTKKVGRKVKVEVPSVDQSGTGTNDQLSGVYVVRNNSHSIIGGYYINALTVMADGLKTKPIVADKGSGSIEKNSATPTTKEQKTNLKSDPKEERTRTVIGN